LVHFGNSFFGCFAGGECDKAKTAGAVGVTFHREEYVGYFAKDFEFFTEAGFVGVVIKISNIKLYSLSISTAIGTFTRSVIAVTIVVMGCR
jgi:hypothetical protein